MNLCSSPRRLHLRYISFCIVSHVMHLFSTFCSSHSSTFLHWFCRFTIFTLKFYCTGFIDIILCSGGVSYSLALMWLSNAEKGTRSLKLICSLSLLALKDILSSIISTTCVLLYRVCTSISTMNFLVEELVKR